MKPLFSFLLGLLAATANYAQVYEPQLLAEDSSNYSLGGRMILDKGQIGIWSQSRGNGIRYIRYDSTLQRVFEYYTGVFVNIGGLLRAPDGSVYISGDRRLNDETFTYLSKLNPSLSPAWNAEGSLKASKNWAEGLALHPDGHIVVAGMHQPSLSDIAVTLTGFSASGSLLWERSYRYGSSAFYTVGIDVANAPGGGFWVLARRSPKPTDSLQTWCWLIRTNAQGDSLSSLHLDASHHSFIQIVQRPDNTYLLLAQSGSAPYVSGIKGSPVLYCISAEGNLLWQRQYHYLNDSTSHSRMTPIRLALTPDGGCVVLSGFAHPPYDTLVGYAEVDIHLMKLDAAGNKQWEKVFGTPDGDEAGDVLVMPGQGYAVCATSWGTIGSQPAPYLYLARFGPDGSTSAQPGLADASRLEVSPNPFSGSLSGSLRLAQPAAARLQLLDLQGRLILEQILPAGSSDFRLRTADLPAGIYLLRADAEGFSQAMKVLKE